MATVAASGRLNKEFKTIAASPPPFIVTHPSDTNILEWHYIITGPPDTPYHNGQYWGTLIFPPEYPFKPPAIRMHTPSGRFSPSTRLCLSISDFHPRSFNPSWSVSTILIGLLSFMTSDEMTTGSIGGTENERKWAAERSRWWNSTGGGSWKDGSTSTARQTQKGNIKAGDGGVKFREQWPEIDKENWQMMKDLDIDPKTGNSRRVASVGTQNCAGVGSIGRPSSSQAVVGAVVEGGRAVGEEGRSWISRHKLLVAGGVIFIYVMVARLLGDGSGGS